MDPVSDDYVNAFVDGELRGTEYDQALDQLELDAEFRQRVCETRNLKEWMRNAYPLPTVVQLPAIPQRSAYRWHVARPALAAVVLFVVGLGGWLLGPNVKFERGSSSSSSTLVAGYQTVGLNMRSSETTRLLLHLSSCETAQMQAVLNVAEQLVQRNPINQVEVVVSSDGLALLRDTSLYRIRIAQLTRSYPTLSFVACNQTLSRLKKEGTPVHLLPEAKLASSAVTEILAKMQHGWVFVYV